MTRRRDHYWFAVLSFIFLLVPLSGPRAQVLAKTPHYVPTATNFGKPHVVNLPSYGSKVGILNCIALSKQENCVIAGIPLINQCDPNLASDVSAPAICGVGCYDASITTVVIAALANRDPKLKLVNRTKEFDDIKAKGKASKVDEQLTWDYRQHADWEKNVMKNGKRVQPFYFAEVVADIGGGKIKQSCDPYTYGDCDKGAGVAESADGKASSFRHFYPKITDDNIENLMLSGYAPMIAYRRYSVTFKHDTAKNLAQLTLVDTNSLHKVAFAGFQPGKYPLLINDVGNAKQYRVHLVSKLSDFKFVPKDPKLQGLQIEYPKVMDGIAAGFSSDVNGKTFLIYEDQDTITEGDSGVHILLVEGYDGLRIATN